MGTFEKVENDSRNSHEAVLLYSSEVPKGSKEVKGIDFNKKQDLDSILSQFLTTGFQATNFGKAVEEINAMLEWRSEEGEKCKIFLGYTSNMVSCGVRETIKYLVQHKLVDCLVTTAGGIEEDFIKCMAPLYVGDFHYNGTDLRKNGFNRIGNLIMPNNNYCHFEDWLNPILDQMLVEQNEQKVVWSPSTMINRLGKEINNEESIYYWAYKNDIPVFCPAVTDGSLGDMLYFHSFKNPGLVLDLVTDIRGINRQAVFAPRTGMIIIGGGVTKHHICNANLMRNGADYAVFINTGHEFDGSDSGASPDEAVSWGKIKMTANPVKLSAEASLVFPLIVSQTFVKYHERNK